MSGQYLSWVTDLILRDYREKLFGCDTNCDTFFALTQFGTLFDWQNLWHFLAVTQIVTLLCFDTHCDTFWHETQIVTFLSVTQIVTLFDLWHKLWRFFGCGTNCALFGWDKDFDTKLLNLIADGSNHWSNPLQPQLVRYSDYIIRNFLTSRKSGQVFLSSLHKKPRTRSIAQANIFGILQTISNFT